MFSPSRPRRKRRRDMGMGKIEVLNDGSAPALAPRPNYIAGPTTFMSRPNWSPLGLARQHWRRDSRPRTASVISRYRVTSSFDDPRRSDTGHSTS